MTRLFVPLLLSLLCLGCTAISPTAPAASSTASTASPPIGPGEGIFAEFTTPRGVITCELYFQQAPLTVTSFVCLAEGTLGPVPRKPYFNGLTFHRVVPGFVIQGGDPTGTGDGGPGYEFPDEFFPGPLQRHEAAGVLSMANGGPDTNGSQFFITLGPARYLDYVHNVFGRVVSGADVPAQIKKDDTFSVKIIRRGRAAQAFKADDKSLAALIDRTPRYPAPHLVDNSPAGPTDIPFQDRYLEYRLTHLAMFGGRHLYVRLEKKFEPEEGADNPAQFVAAQPAKLHLPPGSILAYYFAAEKQWHFAGAPAGFTLPEFKTRPPAKTPPTTPEAIRRREQGDFYFIVEQVVSALIDQTDPKK